ncbi:MAG: hypothetical protein MK212_13280 [Saprospiraceae bacterium]|nr:hypothetical protein [Saprospiraceae bacterium]
MSIQLSLLSTFCLFLSVYSFAQDATLGFPNTTILENSPEKLSSSSHTEQLEHQEEVGSCELDIAKSSNKKADEYQAISWNNMAKDALLKQDYKRAAAFYRQVVEATYLKHTDAASLVIEKQQSIAWRNLRNMSFEQKEYAAAIHFQDNYIHHLQITNPRQYKNQRLHIDKFYAQAYQAQGKSETAIQYLAPYAFGYASEGWSGLDKPTVDYLVELLKTKYTKKQYKRFLSDIHHVIEGEMMDGEMQFYIKILANKIPFQHDSKNYHTKVPMGVASKEQAIAHYQNKLFNSYFYRKLMEKY